MLCSSVGSMKRVESTLGYCSGLNEEYAIVQEDLIQSKTKYIRINFIYVMDIKKYTVSNVKEHLNLMDCMR